MDGDSFRNSSSDSEMLFYHVSTIINIIQYFSGKILIAHKPPFLANFLSTTFYDLKVTFVPIGESPENLMSKYTQEV